jgi:hypothetical protein
VLLEALGMVSPADAALLERAPATDVGRWTVLYADVTFRVAVESFDGLAALVIAPPLAGCVLELGRCIDDEHYWRRGRRGREDHERKSRSARTSRSSPRAPASEECEGNLRRGAVVRQRGAQRPGETGLRRSASTATGTTQSDRAIAT